MKCPACNGTKIETDQTRGHVICMSCGIVLELNTMVSELSFSESSKGAAIADGFTLKIGQARAKSKAYQGNASLRTHQDSSEATRERGHLSIERAGNMQGINMGPNLIEKAKRVYDVALTAKYTKGRKGNCVVAACCYIVCRMEKTSHMMIDFADAFSTNVYQIGACFLQLRIMFLEKTGVGSMPLVDPGLYMARFADKLDFGAETAKVVSNANRIAQRMDRDWIVRGRRPAGICAASLFIAARMNGFKRTTREIVLVVKICEGTLRSRLSEFKNTDSGKLGQSVFETINLDKTHNPPSFSLHKHKREIQVEEDEESEAIVNTQDTLLAEPGPSQEDDEEVALLRETEQLIEKESQKQGQLDLFTQGESLSDLDEDPEIINSLAMSDDETEFKKQLWLAENQDWVDKQASLPPVKPKQPPKKRIRKDTGFKGGTALEATRKLVESKPALSKKINYEVLNELLNEQS